MSTLTYTPPATHARAYMVRITTWLGTVRTVRIEADSPAAALSAAMSPRVMAASIVWE